MSQKLPPDAYFPDKRTYPVGYDGPRYGTVTTSLGQDVTVKKPDLNRVVSRKIYIDSRDRNTSVYPTVLSVPYRLPMEVKQVMSIRLLEFDVLMNSAVGVTTERNIHVSLTVEGERLCTFETVRQDDGQVAYTSVDQFSTFQIPINFNTYLASYGHTVTLPWNQTYYYSTLKPKINSLSISLLSSNGSPATINPMPAIPSPSDLVNPVYNYSLILEMVSQQ